MYPLKGKVKARDVSMCNNGEAEMFDESGHKISDLRSEHVRFRPQGLTTIRITSNNGSLKVKSLAILIRIRPDRVGRNTIVQFLAQGKSVLQLSLQENNLDFSMYSRSDGEHLSAKLMMNSNGNMKAGEWYSVAATYSHVTGNVTLYSSTGRFSNGFLGILEVEEPEYVYLGNNMESMTGGSHEQHSSGPFLGGMRCFIMYRRSLNFSEILQAMNLCKKLPHDKDGDDDDDDNNDDDDDESGGKLSYLITLFMPNIG